MTTTTTSEPSLSDVIAYPPLAFIGRAGSGKTTAANLVAREYGYHVHHFASTLKEAAAIIWSDEEVHHNREKLQFLGNAVREKYPTAWIDAAIAAIDKDRDTHPVCIDDCRFPNEVDPLRQRDFTFVRLLAVEDTRVDRLMRIGKFGTREQLSDVTETSLDDFEADFNIRNEGHPNELAREINQVLSKLRRRT